MGSKVGRQDTYTGSNEIPALTSPSGYCDIAFHSTKRCGVMHTHIEAQEYTLDGPGFTEYRDSLPLSLPYMQVAIA